jgi:hypothetical protein
VSRLGFVVIPHTTSRLIATLAIADIGKATSHPSSWRRFS